MGEETRGIHNWKNLLKKPTLQDWTILFMLIMVFFIAWAYQRDISVCRDYIKYQQELFVQPTIPPNHTIIIKEDTLSGEIGDRQNNNS